MEQQREYTRKGKKFVNVTGTAANGLPCMHTDHLNFEEQYSKGQPVRERLNYINIEFLPDKEGRAVLSNIETDFKLGVLAVNGELLQDLGFNRNMVANKQDLLDFANLLWDMVNGFVENGRVREIEGCNYLPVCMLDANKKSIQIPESYYSNGGKVVDGVVYDQNSQETRNYKTHRVDGTAI